MLRTTTRPTGRYIADHVFDVRNATAAAAVTTAQGGIAEAEGGVRTILLALFTGQQAPEAARGQVEEGLDTVSNALGNLTLYVTSTALFSAFSC